MSTEKIECDHRCRNTCAMLSAALKDEQKAVRYFEAVIQQCDDPGRVAFAKDLHKAHTLAAQKIEERLRQIRASAEILDDIIEGLE